MDRACVDECPVECIYEGERMAYVHPEECVDCGASKLDGAHPDPEPVASLPPRGEV